MSYLFNTFLYQPIINILVLLYNTAAFGDLGVAIIILTILVRLGLAPMYHKMLHQQAATQKIRPEILKIQKEYKNDKEKQTLLMMEAYKKHKINPFYTFLVLLIQLPILLALFRAFTNGLNGEITNIIYPFIESPGAFNPLAFGVIDINEKNILLIAFTAVAQFIQIKLTTPAPQDPKMPMPSSNVMGAFLAVFTIFILWGLPSAVAIYWLTTTLFSIGQQFVCNKSIKHAELTRNHN